MKKYKYAILKYRWYEDKLLVSITRCIKVNKNTKEIYLYKID